MSTYSASAYNDLLRNCRDFNSRFSGQRRYRGPYFDAQTEVSQWPSFLWRSRRERRPGATPSIAYQYTERQWKRPPSSSSFPLAEQMKFNEPENVEKSALATALTKSVSGEPVGADTPGNVAISTSANITEPSFYQFDDFSDAEIEDSDGEDYEESYASKRRSSRKQQPLGKRTPRSSRSKQNTTTTGQDDQIIYPCDICPHKYKTKPGLIYHYQHIHTKMVAAENIEAVTTSSTKGSVVLTHVSSTNGTTVTVSQLQANRQATGGTPVHIQEPAAKADVKKEPNSQEPNDVGLPQGTYCDFCLGTEALNNATKVPEVLVHCQDCGRSGHPSCLKFTPNMIISTGKYGWQCIECKSCFMCGTSENDDQLLFCDDCDKGYHLYCLKPPLAVPPEGNWSCERCLGEFGDKASARAGAQQDGVQQQKVARFGSSPMKIDRVLGKENN